MEELHSYFFFIFDSFSSYENLIIYKYKTLYLTVIIFFLKINFETILVFKKKNDDI